MSEISERYARVADQFTARVEAVPPDAWDRPSPCEGWVARDIVDHLVEWLSAHFFSTWGVPVTAAVGRHEDPVEAWEWLDAGIRAGLADPSIARRASSPHDVATCGAVVIRPGEKRLDSVWGIPGDSPWESFQL